MIPPEKEEKSAIVSARPGSPFCPIGYPSSTVAAAAGVSTTAVSFVLNGRDAGSISATTRARVLKAAEELGYRPNHIARSLRQRSTSSIGLVTDAVASSPFGGRLLAAATETAEASDQVLLMMDIGHRTERVGEAIAALEHRQVDAIIYATMGFTELAEAPESRIPLVLANCVAPTPGPSSVRRRGGRDRCSGASGRSRPPARRHAGRPLRPWKSEFR